MVGLITGLGVTLCGFYWFKDPKNYIEWKSSARIKAQKPPFTEEEKVKLAREGKRMGILALVCGSIVAVISFFEMTGMI